jgi:hypothetical protein
LAAGLGSDGVSGRLPLPEINFSTALIELL